MFADELEFPLTDIKGIGPSYAKMLNAAGIHSVADLLKVVPRNYENRQDTVPLADAYRTGTVNTIVEITAHDYIGFGKKKTLKVYVRDDSASGALICFGRNFLKDKFKPGKKFFLYGHFDYRYGELQSSQFDAEEVSPDPVRFGTILPVYPLAGKLKQGTMRKSIRAALDKYAGSIEDQLPPEIIKRYGFPSRKEAIYSIHFPKTMKEMERSIKFLKYEELFYLQIISARRAFKYRNHTRPRRETGLDLKNKLIESLPFRLTADQEKVLKEIKNDMDSEVPMYRLLQGDVGSGKTLVAFTAALYIIERGGQTAFMAPTELLAKQHAESAARLLEPLGVRIAFLSGNTGSRIRPNLLKALKDGDIDLIIGTHALFTRDVIYKNLEFVIVDEQHKFGVLQRTALFSKGNLPDILLMTATPIPRTITMTIFADLDVSLIKTMPEGRKPVITHLARMGNEERVYRAVRKELEKGHQAYFIYPRITDSGKGYKQLKDAVSAFNHLKTNVFPDYEVALIHSKLPEEEKISIMGSFSSGRIQVLVATSVVEVGVDVKNATCMVVEHAERFGLAALHQLRGRVGRGDAQSYAFLIYSEELSESGKERLKVMMENSDGFALAERDLEIRGPGELAGKKQSGFLKLTFSDIIKDFEILKEARKDAVDILNRDPGLLSASSRVVREVLTRCPPFEDEILSSG